MLSKILSARFWTIMLVTITYCVIVLMTTHSYLQASKATPERLEGFCMGLVMGFAGFAVKALIEYFGRSDRPQTTEVVK